MKHRLWCALIALALLISIGAPDLSARSEGSGDVPPSMALSMTYSKPSEDGRLDAWLNISCDSGDSEEKVAKGVTVQIQAHQRVEFIDVTGPYEISPQPDNCYTLYLHDMSAGSVQQCTLRMKYKYEEPKTTKTLLGTKTEPVHQHLNPDGSIIEPWLKVTVGSENYGRCEYECDLDVNPRARAIIFGWDLDGGTAIENDLGMLEEAYQGCYFNGMPVEVEPVVYNQELTSLEPLINGLDIDDNDVTYIYMNAHGYIGLETHIAGMAQDMDDQIPYEILVGAFSTLSGRLVMVFDSCFSGYAIEVAPNYLDPERMVLLASVSKEMFSGAYETYGWFANDIAKIGGAEGYINWDETVTEALVTSTLVGRIAENAFDAISDLITDPGEENCITVNEVFARESARHIKLAANKLAAFPVYGAYSMFDKEDAIEQILTGINPQIYGNGDLPMFVRSSDYDDNKVIMVVKNEQYEVYPPLGGEVVFSFDELPQYEFGPITMYALSGDGHIIPERSENPEEWTHRTLLTDRNFSYRPAPLSDTGGIGTRIYAERLKDGLIFTEWDAGVVAAGPNDPWCRSIYTIYQIDSDGIKTVLSGECYNYYDTLASGLAYPEMTTYRLGGAQCAEVDFISAFAEHGIAFSQDYLDVNEGSDLTEAYLVGYSDEGEVLLGELRSSVQSELPPSYDELVQLYGLSGSDEQDAESYQPVGE